MSKLTFKREPRQTGLAGVGYPNQSVEIKHKGLVIGSIAAPNWTTKDSLWRVCFMFGDESNWKWKQLKIKFGTEQDARDWVTKNTETILSWNLRHEPKEER